MQQVLEPHLNGVQVQLLKTPTDVRLPSCAAHAFVLTTRLQAKAAHQVQAKGAVVVPSSTPDAQFRQLCELQLAVLGHLAFGAAPVAAAAPAAGRGGGAVKGAIVSSISRAELDAMGARIAAGAGGGGSAGSISALFAPESELGQRLAQVAMARPELDPHTQRRWAAGLHYGSWPNSVTPPPPGMLLATNDWPQALRELGMPCAAPLGPRPFPRCAR